MKKLWILVLCMFVVGCSPAEDSGKKVESDDPIVEDDSSKEGSHEDNTGEGTDSETDPEPEIDAEEPEEPADDPVDEYVPLYEYYLGKLLMVDSNESQVDENGMNIYYSSSWVVPFTEEQIIELGLDGLSGTDKEIADGILQWQKDYMVYADMNAGYNDVSYGMRWVGAFPGIYDTNDILDRQLTDDGKIYGVCHHYANIFAAAADYYGLTVRIGSSVETFADLVDNPYSTLSPTGMSGEEYNAFTDFLEDEGYSVDDFPYEVVRLLVGGGSGEVGGLHGRAEVLLDGVWVAYDKYDDITEGSDDLTYMYDNIWLAGYDPVQYDSLMERYNNGESLLNEGYSSAYEQFLEARIIATSDLGLPGYGGAFDYIGVIDDLGQNRAKNKDDIMNGLALAPYFDNKIDILEFFDSPGWLLEEIDDVMWVQAEIEALTGQPYYSVAEIMTWGDTDITDPDVFVEMYEGFSGAPFNISLWEEYIK